MPYRRFHIATGAFTYLPSSYMKPFGTTPPVHGRSKPGTSLFCNIPKSALLGLSTAVQLKPLQQQGCARSHQNVSGGSSYLNESGLKDHIHHGFAPSEVSGPSGKLGRLQAPLFNVFCEQLKLQAITCPSMKAYLACPSTKIRGIYPKPEP